MRFGDFLIKRAALERITKGILSITGFLRESFGTGILVPLVTKDTVFHFVADFTGGISGICQIKSIAVPIVD